MTFQVRNNKNGKIPAWNEKNGKILGWNEKNGKMKLPFFFSDLKLQNKFTPKKSKNRHRAAPRTFLQTF